MFALLNVKWGDPEFGTPSGTVTWSNALGGNLALADGITPENIDEALGRAFQRWEDVSAIDFERVDSGGNVVVSATTLNVGRPAGDPFVAGLATWSPDQPGLNTITSAKVEFATELLWTPDGVNGTHFFAVALHEIGHILGLDHPPDATQIMNATVSVEDLGPGDIQGAQYLYGTDGNDVPVEPGEPVNQAELEREASEGGGGGGGGIGLLAALFALIFGMFTGGAGAAVAMAAGRVTQKDDDPTDDADQTHAAGHQHCDHVVIGENGEVSHAVYASEFYLADMPTVDFTQLPNPCGCTGMCQHILNDGEVVEVAEADLFE